MDDTIEVANKNIKKIIHKMVKTYKYWHKMLPFTLHDYRTPVHASISTSPFSLVYATEVVLPIKAEIPCLGVMMETKMEDAENGCKQALIN